MGQYNLNRLFKPESIAVIGQTENPKAIGHTILTNLIRSRYDGAVYPVYPNVSEILGRKTIQSVDKLETGVDLAIIAAGVLGPLVLNEATKPKAPPEVIAELEGRNSAAKVQHKNTKQEQAA